MNRLFFPAIFVLISFLLFLPPVLTQEIELPGVDVTGERVMTNSEPGGESAAVSLPGNEGGEGEVLLFPGLDRPKLPEMQEKKNVLFSIGYGLFDRLQTSLTFANKFSNTSYLFTVNRASADDFEHGGKRVYNSQTGLDDADLNLQYHSAKFQWNGRMQYIRETGGLQENTEFSERTTRRIRVGQHGRWPVAAISSLNADFVYDYCDHGVKKAGGGREGEYHRGGLGLAYQAVFAEMNSFKASAMISYQGLAGPGYNGEDIRARIDASDNFLLLSQFDFTLGMGVMYSTVPIVYFLPSARCAWLLSESFRWTFFGRIEESENLIPDQLGQCRWRDAPAGLPAPSAELSTGTGLETLIAGVIPVTLEGAWNSDARMSTVQYNSNFLYESRSRNIDSWSVRFESGLAGIRNLDLRLQYQFRYFESRIDHIPVHSARFTFKWEPSLTSLILRAGYQTGLTFNRRFQKDILETAVEVRRSLSKNMAVFLIVENLAGWENSLYPPYVEPGLSGVLGFRVNLF